MPVFLLVKIKNIQTYVINKKLTIQALNSHNNTMIISLTILFYLILLLRLFFYAF